MYTTQSMANGGLIVIAESNFTCLGEVDLTSDSKTVTLVPLAYQNVLDDNSLLKVDDNNGGWHLRNIGNVNF